MDGIDPRLRGSEPSSSSHAQLYSAVSPTHYPQTPIRLPPPSPQQQHRQQPIQPQLQHVPGYPTWQHDSGEGYYQQPPNARSSNTFLQNHDATPIALQNTAQSAGESRRPRACEACRGLKVRCEFDGGSRDCKRCMKAGRPCQVTQPSRKRQKKTDTKVAELERKLEDLRSELVAKGNLPLDANTEKYRYGKESSSLMGVVDTASPAGDGQKLPVDGKQRHHFPPRSSWSGPAQQQAPYMSSSGLPSRKRRMSSTAEDGDSCLEPQQSSSPVSFHKSPPFNQHYHQTTTATSDTSTIHPLLMAQAAYSNITESAVHNHPGSEMALPDPVAQYLPDDAAASAAFHHYAKDVAPLTPIIVFEPGVNAASIRKTKPILFLAVVAIAYEGEAKSGLIDEIDKTLAYQVVVEGKNSVELMQAMQIMALYCWPQKQAYGSIFTWMSTGMKLPTGLGKLGRDEARNRHWSAWAIQNSHLPPSDILEGARANVGCFLISKK